MRLALYQPDIAANTGAIMRLCACFGLSLDIIEPCGFPLGSKELRRAALDYAEGVAVSRHVCWEAYQQQRGAARLILLSTKSAKPYTDVAFSADDTLLLGSESAGVPDAVHHAADLRVCIPLQPGFRSLNVAMAAAIVAAEALRQLRSVGM